MLRALSFDQRYWWRVRACNEAGWGAFSQTQTFFVHSPATKAFPRAFELKTAGISGAQAVIRYGLPEAAVVSIRLFDMRGRRVVSAINREQNPGRYSFSLRPFRLSPACYILRFSAGRYVRTGKMLVE
jgi:hypothetical protein